MLRFFGNTPKNLEWFPKHRKFNRIQGLPIRDCPVSFNNLVPRFSKLSAIDVIANTIFERLYLVSGLRRCAPRVNCPYAPTPPPINLRPFLVFRAIFFASGPSQVFTQTISNENAAARVKERAEVGGPSVATVRQTAFCHFVQRSFVGRTFSACRCLCPPVICVCSECCCNCMRLLPGFLAKGIVLKHSMLRLQG